MCNHTCFMPIFKDLQGTHFHRLLCSPIRKLISGCYYSKWFRFGVACLQQANFFPKRKATRWSFGDRGISPRDMVCWGVRYPFLQVRLVGEGVVRWGDQLSLSLHLQNLQLLSWVCGGTLRDVVQPLMGWPFAFSVVQSSDQLGLHIFCLSGLPLIFLECPYPILWTILLENV